MVRGRSGRLTPPAVVLAGVVVATAVAIAVGADSGGAPVVGVDAGKVRRHWAFGAVAAVTPLPVVRGAAWCRNSVDYFVVRALEARGLSPSGEADRYTLGRRVYLDLTGLPPSAEQIEGFVKDAAPDAYERLVDRLLASPGYGERWGGHWLDVAGYADSNGYFEADTDRPLAWAYRDYVVRAFNEDKPFDQFVREQIAGDEIAGYAAGEEVRPCDAELLTATHFLRNAPDGTGESDGNPQELAADRYAVLEGNVQVIGSALLGLTVQCARCHDHKFEPVSQREYYGLQAVLKPAYDHDRWLKPGQRTAVVGEHAEVARTRATIERADREIAALKDSAEGLRGPLVKLIRAERLAGVADRAAIEKALETDAKKRTEAMKALLKRYAKQVEVSDEAVAARFPEVGAELKKVAEGVAEREQKKPVLRQVAVLSEPTTRPAAHHVLGRGRYTDPGAVAEPGGLSVLSGAGNAYRIEDGSARTSGRRLAFAKWVTSPAHPTFARLAVNRIWQQHFGTGIVASVENVGLTGAAPSHPELLDFLAAELVRQGWHLKAIQRLIVCSATYRQAGNARKDGMAVDPENRLLWRFPQQRLAGEVVRDAMLAASGELDATVGGPYVAVTADAQGQMVTPEDRAGARRRSIYLQHRRTKPSTMLEVFDTPEMTPNCTRRSPSTVTLQSLAMLNSEFVRRRSGALGRRVVTGGTDDAGRIRLAFMSVVSRGPTGEEREAAAEFVARQRREYGAGAEERVWTDLCQMLFAGNAFLYVD